MRYLVLFAGIGLAYTGFSGSSAAQELSYSQNENAAPVAAAEIGQDAFIPLSLISNHDSRLPGGPVVVLPVPVPGSGTSGSNSTYGFQYPGSYMPRDTPLHRFNGYIVCDPPKPAGGVTATASESAGTPSGTPSVRRMVKITTTRSLAAPGYSQPCPIYTIGGEIQKNDSPTTRSSR